MNWVDGEQYRAPRGCGANGWDAPAAQALLGYMEWWSEEFYCAGWLVDLHVVMARRDEPFGWLVHQARGYWRWDDHGDGPVFVTADDMDVVAEVLGLLNFERREPTPVKPIPLVGESETGRKIR